MDPIAGAWESWADTPTKETKQPQDDQDYYDSPHNFSPFEGSSEYHQTYKSQITWRS
jgi:hypothetical protein